MIVLVLNCGSSSIKYQLFEMGESTNMLAKGMIERIGLNDSVLTHNVNSREPYRVISDIPDHTLGINQVMSVLTDPDHGVIKDITEIKAVGHRVVNGGESYKESVLVNSEVKKQIARVTPRKGTQTTAPLYCTFLCGEAGQLLFL